MKDHYNMKLRCATCGSEDNFEYNEDKSYVKCKLCNREYFGGIKELVTYNIETYEAFKEQMAEDVRTSIQDELCKVLKGCKNIKLK